jgi:hypothetical protein
MAVNGVRIDEERFLIDNLENTVPSNAKIPVHRSLLHSFSSFSDSKEFIK